VTIATFNVNGIKRRLPVLPRWLAQAGSMSEFNRWQGIRNSADHSAFFIFIFAAALPQLSHLKCVRVL
jgi:hypothetical protein